MPKMKHESMKCWAQFRSLTPRHNLPPVKPNPAITVGAAMATQSDLDKRNCFQAENKINEVICLKMPFAILQNTAL